VYRGTYACRLRCSGSTTNRFGGSDGERSIGDQDEIR
jgi:hypothetical protein